MNIKKIKNAREIPLQFGYCIYFLTDAIGEIVYVGQSNAQTLSRISSHTKTKSFDKAFIIKVKDKPTADLLEAKYIVQIKPKYNAKIELRRKIGLVNRSDIKKETGLNMALVKRIAAENKIGPVLFGGKYWPEVLIDLLKKHIADHPEKFKNKSKNSIRI